MTTRETKLLWMKDMIDHLRVCQQQLNWTEDVATIHVLTETMLRDLDRCRRLCEEMSRRSPYQHA